MYTADRTVGRPTPKEEPGSECLADGPLVRRIRLQRQPSMESKLRESSFDVEAVYEEVEDEMGVVRTDRVRSEITRSRTVMEEQNVVNEEYSSLFFDVEGSEEGLPLVVDARKKSSMEKILLAMKICYLSKWFWFLVAFFCVMEPIICAQDPTMHRTIFILQWFVLFISTHLFFIEVLGAVELERERAQKANEKFKKEAALAAASTTTTGSELREAEAESLSRRRLCNALRRQSSQNAEAELEAGRLVECQMDYGMWLPGKIEKINQVEAEGGKFEFTYDVLLSQSGVKECNVIRSRLLAAQKKSFSEAWEAIFDTIFTGEFVLEFMCLLCGWIFLYRRPGIAILRCFRLLRLLYFHNLPSEVLDDMIIDYHIPTEPGGKPIKIMKSCKFDWRVRHIKANNIVKDKGFKPEKLTPYQVKELKVVAAHYDKLTKARSLAQQSLRKLAVWKAAQQGIGGTTAFCIFVAKCWGKEDVKKTGLKSGLSMLLNFMTCYKATRSKTDLYVDLLFKVMKFASDSLQSMSQEMFFLTDKTRGGFILMVLLFYSAYVLGATLWVETRDAEKPLTGFEFDPEGNPTCTVLGNCVFTMLRITLFDGTGLDFAFWLAEYDKFLFAIIVIYLCATAFGIFNGLIGVFGQIFQQNSGATFNIKEDTGAALEQKMDKLMDAIEKLAKKTKDLAFASQRDPLFESDRSLDKNFAALSSINVKVEALSFELAQAPTAKLDEQLESISLQDEKQAAKDENIEVKAAPATGGDGASEAPLAEFYLGPPLLVEAKAEDEGARDGTMSVASLSDKVHLTPVSTYCSSDGSTFYVYSLLPPPSVDGLYSRLVFLLDECNSIEPIKIEIGRSVYDALATAKAACGGSEEGSSSSVDIKLEVVICHECPSSFLSATATRGPSILVAPRIFFSPSLPGFVRGEGPVVTLPLYFEPDVDLNELKADAHCLWSPFASEDEEDSKSITALRAREGIEYDSLDLSLSLSGDVVLLTFRSLHFSSFAWLAGAAIVAAAAGAAVVAAAGYLSTHKANVYLHTYMSLSTPIVSVGTEARLLFRILGHRRPLTIPNYYRIDVTRHLSLLAGTDSLTLSIRSNEPAWLQKVSPINDTKEIPILGDEEEEADDLADAVFQVIALPNDPSYAPIDVRFTLGDGHEIRVERPFRLVKSPAAVAAAAPAVHAHAPPLPAPTPPILPVASLAAAGGGGGGAAAGGGGGGGAGASAAKRDVFLSHAWGNDHAVHRLVANIARVLVSRGISVWLDKEEDGATSRDLQPCEDMFLQMNRGIDNSRIFLAFVTPLYRYKANAAAHEEWAVRHELLEARASKLSYGLKMHSVVLHASMTNQDTWDDGSWVEGGVVVDSGAGSDRLLWRCFRNTLYTNLVGIDALEVNSAEFSNRLDGLVDIINALLTTAAGGAGGVGGGGAPP